VEVELVLVGGERRKIVLPRHTGSIVNVLDRLEEWVETDDGGWVQKKYIIEVRLSAPKPEAGEEADDEKQRTSE
jgi:hypothetical protein